MGIPTIPYIQIITEAYLQFQNEQSKTIFGKELCDLKIEDTDSLKELVPLRISINARSDENRHKRIMNIENNGW